MQPRLYLPCAAIVLSAALAAVSCAPSARNPGRCLEFSGYDFLCSRQQSHNTTKKPKRRIAGPKERYAPALAASTERPLKPSDGYKPPANNGCGVVKTRTQLAVYPDLSEHDWSVMLCSVSGEGLIRRTDELLERRAVLRTLLGEIWFSPEAAQKQEEWIKAEQELHGVDEELAGLQERAKAIIKAASRN
jgi:hypothetical protein